MPYGSPKVSIPLKKYYEQFPEAEIIHYSEEDDLAVIKFSSDEDLNVLNIATKNPKKGEPICTIGNPGVERFVVTYGYVKSNKFRATNLSDTKIPKNGVKLNAYTEDGNNGGAVLNKEMEIVGIVVGSSRDIFHRFRNTVMIPAESIHEFLKQWSSE